MQENFATMPDWWQSMIPSLEPFIPPSQKPASTMNQANKPAAAARGARPLRAQEAAPAVPVNGYSCQNGADGATHMASTDLTRANEDKALLEYVDGMAGGDESALAKLYDATVSRVYGVALRIVRQREHAEEVVTDVYMQVWKDAARYDQSRGRVLAWLLIIARSRALDLLRRQEEAFSHPDPHILVDEPEGGNNPHDLLLATQDNEALQQALIALTPLQRQLLSLAFFKGLSHSEIVEHSGIALGSVKTHIRRALSQLRVALDRDPAFTK
jgi:RNA polymerase sigma-70 factor (ECF subfamily)